MPEPTKIPRPFADSGDKNTIPESSGALGFASWQEGFPAITGTPFAQGGIAPKRADFNGIFNALSLAILWQQQGGFYEYDATTNYEVGNVVEYNNDLYKCITANGPSSAVKDPTDTTVWSKVMTAADAAALYLPLSGGTMTGSIVSDSGGYVIRGKTNDLQVTFLAGNSGNSAYGAKLLLNGADYTNSGWFTLQGGNSTGYKQLIGKPDGTLTWDDKNVVTVETGTWTPTVYGSSTAGATTISSNTSYYQKFGNLIFLRVNFRYTITSSPAGEVRIGGLPYAADFFYQGPGGTNTNPCQYFNLSNSGYIRTQVYTSSGTGASTSWGATTTSTAWANGVGKNDLVLGYIWYRTTE